MHRLSHQVSWNITTRGSEPKLAQGGGAQHVNPARSACNPETCLIQMFHYGLFARQQVFHRVGKKCSCPWSVWRSAWPALPL